MKDPDMKSYRLDGTSPEQQENKHLQTLAELGLLDADRIPVFEEATQIAAHLLEAPICILSIVESDRQYFKAAVGLSRLGLMNELATTRTLPLPEALCLKVLETRRSVAIQDTLADPEVNQSLLVQHYGIRGYLGVPLITANGNCIGTLAVMDLVPRQFSSREREYLEITCRWAWSEYERDRLLKGFAPGNAHALNSESTARLGSYAARNLAHDAAANLSDATNLATNQIKIELLKQLTQDLRTPLTSVMGMASVLGRETFGPLTGKQKEYLDIIHKSGQHLLSLVNEIVDLGAFEEVNPDLKLNSVDIEMLCQQVINSLESVAKRQDQEIRLSVEPGNRIWLLDKSVVRQILYHLVLCVIQSATAASSVRIHVSRKVRGTALSPQGVLTIAVWVSNPWLGEGLPHTELDTFPVTIREESSLGLSVEKTPESLAIASTLGDRVTSAYEAILKESYAHCDLDTNPNLIKAEDPEKLLDPNSSENLRLMLSRQLVQLHGGQLAIQGSAESGYRFVVSLPVLGNMGQ